MCTSTSYGGLQLGTCMYLFFFLWLGLCFLMPLLLSKLHKLFLLIILFLHGFNKDVWSLKGHEHNMVTIFSAPNYCYWAICHWTFYVAPIIDFFLSLLYACFHHVWRFFFTSRVLLMMNIFGGSIGNMFDLGPFCCR